MMGAFDTKSKGDDVTSADWNELTAALGGGKPAQGTAYVFFYDSDDSEYKSRNGLDGTIDARGTDADTALNAVIGDCSHGESIFIRRLDATIDSAITVNKQLNIIGEAVYDAAGVRKGVRFYSGNAINLFEISVDYCYLKNIVVNGQGGTASAGFYLDDARFCTLDHCTAQSFPSGSGFKIEGYSNTLINPIASNCLYGLHLLAGASYNPNALVVLGGRLTSNVANAYGVYLDAGDTLTMLGPDITASVATMKGIYVDWVNSRMKLFGPRFEGSGVNMASGIEWNTGGQDIVLGASFSSVSNPIVNQPMSSVVTSSPFGYAGLLNQIEHHTSSDTLTNAESGTVHTNLGAGGAVKLTLPQSTYAGVYFDFVVMTTQQLQIEPGAAGAIYINGAKQTDDKYIWADDEAESVRLVADGNGDWIAIGAVGTWGVEA